MGSGPRGSKSMVGKVQPVLGLLCAVWVTVAAISVETPQEVLRAARGRSVTLPCTYRTSAPTWQGLIQWDKLLLSHTEKVAILTLPDQSLSHGDRYQNRVNFSGDAWQSDASVTIGQLTMDDNGTYECSVSLLQDLDGTSKGRVRLLVLVPPSKPDCSIQGETVIGNDIQLACQSKEGSPTPQYSWKSFDLQNQEQIGPPGVGQTLTLKNISTDMSGFYICTSSNEVGTESCNITLTVRPPSMNVALYAGIAGGAVVALILIGVLIYCCCCRAKGEDKSRPNRSIYREPQEQLRDLSQRRQEEGDSEHGDWGSRRHS
ncbi:cell surface A33 antigen [Desmodus rotundus]|uniref:cell surface A33 antigen n=1 Tax=Desmodus rotundus TaxID=9430 RepID=UPI00238126EA|nr:cell surface A33 antigen [Desmodus rotundus]